jgi:hypothetical protein
MDFKSFRSKMIEAYGRNRGYAHGFASPHAPSLGGPRHREDDEGWDREPKQADVPHAVHINGKKWKSYGSQSHAQNVAKKIKGATVHKEEVELEEAKDAREYDYEGDMAKSQLRSIIANAQRAHDMLEDDTNMAEWVQSKITLAADYISTVADYMQAEVNEAATASQQAAIAIDMKKKGIKPKNEEVDLAEDIKKEYHAMKQHDIKTLRNMIKGQQRIVDTSEYRTKDHAISAYLRHKHGDKRVAAAMGLKEEEITTRIWEAWGMGRRDPQKGIKVGHQVRSYDFPGMHDDHYIEGHVVGETPHSYHIRTNRVVRAGKEVPIPAHMGHVEAPKGRGMFSDAYAVHKIVAKQDSVAAQPEPAQGGARTFANVRGKR